MKTDKLISFLLPSRNEFPQIVFTIYSIIHAMEADGFTEKDFELIIGNNNSDDRKWPQQATGGTSDFFVHRGMYAKNIVRIFYDPIAGNHKVTNHLARIARGKYIFRSDAHMAYQPGFFSRWMQTVEESKGVVHTGIHWMGTYPSELRTLGIAYTLKFGEEFKGTWNGYHLTGGKDWFYIPMQGHAGFGMLREQFLAMRGYHPMIRAYGGGEIYLDMKAWMLGIPVVAEPRCVSYHLSAGRGYSYDHDDYIHNVLLVGLSLGADMWVERAKINWLRRGRREVVEHLWDLAVQESKEDRAWFKRWAKKKGPVTSFDQLMIDRPWEKLNDQKHGQHIESLLVYQPTFERLLEEGSYAKQVYDASPLQKKFKEFVYEHLPKYIYKS